MTDFSFFRSSNGIYITKESFLLEIENGFFNINPHFSFEKSDKYIDLRIGYKLSKAKINRNTGEIELCRFNKKSTKTFMIHNEIMATLKKIESIILRELYKLTTTNPRNISIHFDNDEPFLFFNQRITDIQTTKTITLDETLDIMGITSQVKNLEDFYNDLNIGMKINEIKIQEIFKKHQNLLPLVLIGVDATLKFEFSIDVEDGRDTNRVDAICSHSEGNINLVELKRNDAIMFDKTRVYRNNTFPPSKEFTNAIQQTNIQRLRLAQTSGSDYQRAMAKSILIYGNCSEEFSKHEHKNDLELNLSVIKFNNKDITIMSYDQVLDRIQLLLQKNQISIE